MLGIDARELVDPYVDISTHNASDQPLNNPSHPSSRALAHINQPAFCGASVNESPQPLLTPRP
jgi:hypothetical protein